VTLHTHKTMEREGVRIGANHAQGRKGCCGCWMMRPWQRGGMGYFTISSHALDVHFRRARDRLLLTDLHFHDSRADALTRLSRRMDVSKRPGEAS